MVGSFLIRDRLGNKCHRGFSQIELIVSIGLVAILAMAAIFGVKSLSVVQKHEAAKMEILNQHKEIKSLLGRDLKHATKLIGSTSSFLYPISRIPTSSSVLYSPSDAFDGISIYKELYPDSWGHLMISPPLTNQPSFTIFYVLENPSAPTDQDQLFQLAFRKNKYFFLTSSDFRNIIENLDYGATGSPSAVTCPACYSTDATFCSNQRCYSFNGGYHDTMGNVISDPTTILDIAQVKRVDANIRIGEKITYQVGGSCSSGTLCRIVDDNSSLKSELLSKLTKFHVLYEFNLPSESTVKPSALLRSPRESSYWTALGGDDQARAVNAVSFSDVASLELKIEEQLPSALAQAISESPKGGPFEPVSGSFAYTSLMKFRPGIGLETSAAISGQNDFDPNCPSLQQSQCKPGGVCNYLFTNPDPNAPNSTKYQYNTTSPSDYCVCGWNTTDSRFYDPSIPTNQKKLPFLNTRARNIYAVPSADYGPVNFDASMACARFLDCGNPTGHSNDIMDQQNPLCPLARYCVHDDFRAQIYSQVAGFNETALGTMVEQSLPSSGHLKCTWTAGGKANYCDQWYNIYKDRSPVSSGALSYFRRYCACVVQEFDHYNSDGTPVLTTRRPVGLDQLDFDSLCRVPGATTACTETWDVASKAWIPQDSSHTQALPRTLAELCACRRNPTPDGIDVRSTDFIAAKAPKDVLSYGSNKIISIDYTGTGFGGSWSTADWQYRFGNHLFNFQVTNFKALTVQPSVSPSPSPIPNPYSAGSELTNLLTPPTNDATSPYWWACGIKHTSSGSSLGVPDPKCLSYKSQWANARVLLPGGSVSSRDINCGAQQYSYSRGARRVPGGCFETSHKEKDMDLMNWPFDIIGENDPLYSYRFFCHNDCGQGAYSDYKKSFTNQVNYIRTLIRLAAGETDKYAPWCPDLSTPPPPAVVPPPASVTTKTTGGSVTVTPGGNSSGSGGGSAGGASSLPVSTSTGNLGLTILGGTN